MKGKRLCVAVSGVHLGENSQPGAGVIRSLRDSGVALHAVGLAYDAFDSSLYAPGVLDDAFLLPYPSASPSAYLERLLEIDAQCGIDVLIPCLDVELSVLASISGELSRAGIACVLPSRQALEATRKHRLPELAKALGIDVPETLTLNDLPALEEAVTTLGFPLVLKGPFYEAEIVHNRQHAHATFARLAQSWGLPLLAQRYVAGEEYNVALLGDGAGHAYGAVTMRKTILTKMGKAWGGITVRDQRVTEVAHRVVKGLAWRGGCEVEVLKDATGRIYLIEVNPRFPAWIYLSAAAGCNLVQGLVQLALGQTPNHLGTYAAGVFYVRHAAEAIGTISDIEQLVSGGRKSSPPPPAPLPHLDNGRDNGGNSPAVIVLQ